MYNSNDFEAEFCQKAWQIISDISEQLSHNQKFAASLLNQAHKLKDEAAEAKTGFSLRRFNVDITKERLESELERVNAHLLVENQSLSHENKQLSFLLKEYEQTVENIMNKLRAHSVSSSVYEAELMRYYESRLSQDIITPYSVDHSQTSQHLQRLVRGLHAVLAFMDGKTPADLPEDFNAEDFVHSYADPSAPLQPPAIEIPEVISIPSPREHHESVPTYPPPLYPETPSTASSSASSSSESPSPPPSESHHPEPSSQAAHVPSGSEPKAQTADSARLEDLSWAEAREVEIERLAAENARMRQLLGIDDESMTTAGLPLTVEFPPTVLPLEAPPPAPTPAPPPSSRRPRLSGGMFVPAAWHQAQQEQAQGGWTAPPGAQQRLAMPMGGGSGQQFPAQGQMQQPLPQQFQQGPPLQSLAQHQWTNNFSGRGGLFAGGLMGGAPSRGGVGSFRGRGAWTVG